MKNLISIFQTPAAIRALALPLLVAAFGLPAGPIASANVVQNGEFANGLTGWVATQSHPFDASTIDLLDAVNGTTHALAINVENAPQQAWKVQVRQPLAGQSVAANERIRVAFDARSPQGSPVAVAVQLANAPFTPLAYQRFDLTPTWQRHSLNLPAKSAGGALQFTITAGFAAGRVELTNIVVDLGDTQEKAPDRNINTITPNGTGRDALRRFNTPSLGLESLVHLLGDTAASSIEDVRGFTMIGGRGRLMPVSDGIRLVTQERTEWTYQAQALQPTTASIAAGDNLLAVAKWRVHEPNALLGYATLGLMFELAGPPHASDATRVVTAAASDWQTTTVAFRASRDYAPGEANVLLRVGYGPQTIDVADVVLINLTRELGSEFNLEQLDLPQASYGGAEPDAPWRAEAEERIAQYRQGTIRIRVIDKSGQPIPDVRVEVAMKRHDFGFGGCMSVHRFPGGRAADTAGPYLDVATRLFNWGVLENALKWPLADDAYFQTQAETAMAWMLDQGMTIRGHTLVWPSFRRSPAELQSLSGDPAALNERFEQRIREAAGRWAGMVYAWDAVNEPYRHRDVLDLLAGNPIGQKDPDRSRDHEFIARWLRVAREADPKALLFINDFQLLSSPAAQPVRMSYYLDLIDKLQRDGAPIDGIGVQAHFSGELTPIPAILDRLDAFAQRGLRVHITEFDIATDDEQLQADYTRDFFLACYSHPAVEAIVNWGYWEGQMFQKKGALFREDWSIKPVGRVVGASILDRWRTRATLTTGAQGYAEVIGYTGQYDVRAVVNGAVESATFDLTRDGHEVMLTVPCR